MIQEGDNQKEMWKQEVVNMLEGSKQIMVNKRPLGIRKVRSYTGNNFMICASSIKYFLTTSLQ